MGGPGSGYFSWRRPTRNLVERSFVLDVTLLKKIVREGEGVAGHLTLVARATGETLPVNYVADLHDPGNPHLHLTFQSASRWQDQVVSLATTRPHYGSARYWMLCPVSGARTRCLYLPVGATEFASRIVHGLAYRSQSENAFWRGVRKAQKIRATLGGDGSIYAPFPPRPQGMRNQTYERLRSKAIAIEKDAREKLRGARLSRVSSRPQPRFERTELRDAGNLGEVSELEPKMILKVWQSPNMSRGTLLEAVPWDSQKFCSCGACIS